MEKSLEDADQTETSDKEEEFVFEPELDDRRREQME